MAKVFLDTNYFIDAIHRKPEKQILESLEGCLVCVSTLSFHIYCYIYKIKIPDEKVLSQRVNFQCTSLSRGVLDKALNGPTSDFEDNVQLHSAVEANCDLFLTSDQKLLKLKVFGKVKLVSNL